MLNVTPRPPRCHSIRAGSSSRLRRALLPMKLSSTKKMLAAPAAGIQASSSAITCAALFVRGRWPSSAVTLQNSQLNGQPREY